MERHSEQNAYTLNGETFGAGRVHVEWRDIRSRTRTCGSGTVLRAEWLIDIMGIPYGEATLLIPF